GHAGERLRVVQVMGLEVPSDVGHSRGDHGAGQRQPVGLHDGQFDRLHEAQEDEVRRLWPVRGQRRGRRGRRGGGRGGGGWGGRGGGGGGGRGGRLLGGGRGGQHGKGQAGAGGGHGEATQAPHERASVEDPLDVVHGGAVLPVNLSGQVPQSVRVHAGRLLLV